MQSLSGEGFDRFPTLNMDTCDPLLSFSFPPAVFALVRLAVKISAGRNVTRLAARLVGEAEGVQVFPCSHVTTPIRDHIWSIIVPL